MAELTPWNVPYSAQQLQNAWANCAPKIGTNETWETWDIDTGDWSDTGVRAAVKDAYIGASNHWYVWDSLTSAYVDSGVVAGYNAYNGDVEAVT